MATIVEKMSEANGKVSKKAEQCVTEVVMTGGYFPLNLVSAFLFSDKSYLSSRLKGSVKEVFTRFTLIEFMLDHYEDQPSKK